MPQHMNENGRGVSRDCGVPSTEHAGASSVSIWMDFLLNFTIHSYLHEVELAGGSLNGGLGETLATVSDPNL